MRKIVQNIPNGGLDADSDNRYVDETDYRYALNIRNGVAYAGKQSVATNVKGNELVAYTLPAGTNKVVGAYNDTQQNTVIYFVWNSNGNDQILRYYPDTNEIKLIAQYDLGWTAATKITSISLINAKLLYWCDPKPRKINIEKATLDGKYKEWEIVLAKSNITANTFTMKALSMNGNVLKTVVLHVDAAPVGEKLSELAGLINSHNGFGDYFLAEYCDCKITVKELQPNSYYFIFESAPEYLIVPTNWYGLTLTDRMFDRAKWQPPYEPITAYKKNPDINYNRVKDLVFQFRLQYWYDDNEGADLACGAISEIPINNIGCNGIPDTTYNYIELNIPDGSLITPADLTILKQVRILVRQNNEGNWRIVENIDLCQWFDYVDGEQVATYDFYNTIATTAIDDATVSKPYDDVPHECEAEIEVKKRGILANVVKGYDAPDCVEIGVEQTFEDTAKPQGYTISGLARIFNPQLDDNGGPINRLSSPNILERRGGIFKKTDLSDYPIYGGALYDSNTFYLTDTPSGATIPPIENAYNKEQIVPEGGFTFYLTGTDFYGISKQKSDSALTQGVTGAIDVNDTDSINKTNAFYTTGGDIYSDFQIRNVPPGKYVLRVASPWVSLGDKLNKGQMYDLTSGRSYQSTSAPVWGVNQYDAGTGNYTWMPECEMTIEVTNSDVFVGEFIIKDHVIYYEVGGGSGYTVAVTGYVLDAEGSTEVQDLKLGATVEKSQVTQYANLANPYQQLGIDWTDHNGYFSVYNGTLATQRTVEVDQINQNLAITTVIHDFAGSQYYTIRGEKGALQQLQDGTISPTYSGTDGWFECIIPVTLATARATLSTFVKGRILDQNNEPISGALIVYENGRKAYSDENGQFSILAWGDMRGAALSGNQNNRVVDSVIININSLCPATYPNGNEFPVLLQPFIPTYTPSNFYITGDLIIDVDNSGIIKARKRGGSYLLGLRFYDDAGRYCTVSQGAEVYIPFITEDLAQYFPTEYPVGTYKYGPPTITATINTPPPSWAKYARFMWTRNLYQGRYLQWCANEIKYITSYNNTTDTYVETTYANGDATMIMISVSNIATFANYHNNSQIGYSFEAGDRVRLIANRDSIYFQGLYDTEVIDYKLGGWIVIQNQVALPEIQSGLYFEVYNNKPVTEDKIFYECGQPITITNGQYDNQQVTFDSGDTYWRTRLIPVNDDTTNYNALYPLNVEDRSISDFYSSEDEDIGRTGIIDPSFKEIHYPTMMQHSNIYVEGSSVNGLSSFEAVNYKQLTVNFGGIKRLFYVGNTLISIHENKVVANYIQLRSLSDSNTTDGLLAISDAYFGNDRPLETEYGTQHPESCYQYNGLIYFLDVARGVVCRYDNNGLDVISDKKMRSYFKERCSQGVVSAWSVFDPYYREYIVSLDTDTIAWSEPKNRWNTFYSFAGECYATILRSIVSFKDGALWFHDKNPVYNNFYGVQYTSKITPIPHLDNDKVIWFAFNLQGSQAQVNTNNWAVPSITNTDGQQSRLTKFNFKKLESMWYAAFLRDETDTTMPDPIINGRNLRGQELVMEMENDSTQEWYFQQLITEYTPSSKTPI